MKNEEFAHTKASLLGSLLLFTQTFYKIRTGRDFRISQPVSQESHLITIARNLTDVFEGGVKKLAVNIPPRYHKTEMLIHFVAWSLAHYPDCNFLYLSYSHSLAKKQTQTIRDILQLTAYQRLFDAKIKEDASAKDNFETEQGGSVYAAGIGGTITGRGAGLAGVSRFGGTMLFDDLHKPDEVDSDTMRESTIEWLYNTAFSRLNGGASTPIIAIGQRLAENDVFGHIKETDKSWSFLEMPARDIHGNPLYPEMHSAEDLKRMEELSEYNFWAQMMQKPQPAGGGIYKPTHAVIMPREPKILATFITVDTDETDKTYTDASAFSFWGIYKIMQGEQEIDMYGLHWLSCQEVRVETADLYQTFMEFYYGCLRHPVQPKQIIIEKKSAGVTLLSIVNRLQGIECPTLDLFKTKPKVSRFRDCQPFWNAKQISFTQGADHATKCIEHMRKITHNGSHAHDDICDTFADACYATFINKITTTHLRASNDENNRKADFIMQSFNQLEYLKSKRYGNIR